MGCMTVTLLVFLFTCKGLPQERWMQENSAIIFDKNRFITILAFGILISGLVIVKQFSDLIFKSLLKEQFQERFLELSPFLGNFSFWAGVTALAISLLCLLIGPLLFNRFGWRLTALISPVVVLTTLLVIVAGSNYHLLPLASNWFHEGALMGLKGALLIPVIQIGYIFFSKDYRFQMNAWATLFLAPLFKSIGSFAAEASVFYAGDLVNFYLILLASLTLILMVVAIIYLSSRTKTEELQEAL